MLNQSKVSASSSLDQAINQFRGLLAGSQQSVYLYLGDDAKACNQRFATLLGYRSPEEWEAVQGPFPQAFVEVGSQPALVHAFKEAMQDGVASATAITWKRKDGRTVPSHVILVPVDVGGERMALHFIDA